MNLTNHTVFSPELSSNKYSRQQGESGPHFLYSANCFRILLCISLQKVLPNKNNEVRCKSIANLFQSFPALRPLLADMIGAFSIHLSIYLYTLAVSPSLGGSRQHKRNKQKQWGFHSVLPAMTRDPAEFGWHCWSNTTHPPPSSTTYVAS